MKKVTKGSCELVLCQEIRYLDAMGEFPEPNQMYVYIYIFPKHEEIENLDRSEINMEMESIKDISQTRKALIREFHS